MVYYCVISSPFLSSQCSQFVHAFITFWMCVFFQCMLIFCSISYYSNLKKCQNIIMLKRNYIQNIIIFSSMLKRNNVQLWEVTEGQLAQTPKTLVKREEFFFSRVPSDVKPSGEVFVPCPLALRKRQTSVCQIHHLIKRSGVCNDNN